MKLIFKQGEVKIWAVTERHGTDYWVYGVTQSGDPRVCPSSGMAFEIAAAFTAPATSFLEANGATVRHTAPID